jgi:hypothetical protein
MVIANIANKKNGMNMQQKKKKKKKLGDTTIEHITINSALLFDPH